MQCFLSPTGHPSTATNWSTPQRLVPTVKAHIFSAPKLLDQDIHQPPPNLRQNDPAYRIGHAHIGVAQGKLHQFIAGMRHLQKR